MAIEKNPLDESSYLVKRTSGTRLLPGVSSAVKVAAAGAGLAGVAVVGDGAVQFIGSHPITLQMVEQIPSIDGGVVVIGTALSIALATATRMTCGPDVQRAHAAGLRRVSNIQFWGAGTCAALAGGIAATDTFVAHLPPVAGVVATLCLISAPSAAGMAVGSRLAARVVQGPQARTNARGLEE